MENFTNKNGNFQIYPTNIDFDQGNRDTNKDILGVNRLTKKNDLKDEGINQKVHDLDVEDVTSKISSSRDATWDAFRLCRVKGHPAIGPVPPMEPAAGNAADSCADNCPVEAEVTSWAGQ